MADETGELMNRTARRRQAACLRRGEVKKAYDLAFLFSETEAAHFVGLSRASLWRRVADGTLSKPIRIGGRSLWRRDELIADIERATAQRDANEAA